VSEDSKIKKEKKVERWKEYVREEKKRLVFMKT
jgi:hypothetical protein